MAFQHMKEVVQKAASSKGGKIKTLKGLGAMSPEKRREIQSMGGKASAKNRSNKAGKKEVSPRTVEVNLADLLGDINE